MAEPQLNRLRVRLLHVDSELVVVAGLGIDRPTGSNFTVTDTSSFITSQLIFQNDAHYLLS